MRETTVCGHCGYPLEEIGGIWCHTVVAAYMMQPHIAEPAPEAK